MLNGMSNTLIKLLSKAAKDANKPLDPSVDSTVLRQCDFCSLLLEHSVRGLLKIPRLFISYLFVCWLKWFAFSFS